MSASQSINANLGIPRLLAKSVGSEGLRSHHTLQGHTAMVVAAAHRLLNARGVASLRAVDLPESSIERLRRIVLIAAFLHDLGKCSLHFQQMVRGVELTQLVRHEAATLWLAWPGRPLSDWLAEAAGGKAELMLALCAAAGHHRKFVHAAIAPRDRWKEMPLLADHPDFRELLERAAGMTKLPLGSPPVLSRSCIDPWQEPPEALLADWEDQCRDVVEEHHLLLAITKALVLDADVAGSAIPKSGEPLSWIDEALAYREQREALRRVVNKRLNGGSLRPFQEQVAAASAPVTLVVAGCGTGKTIAAYQWAADQHPGRQLWVTYPTTGTTTEGYRDYASDPSLELDARLEHSRAEVDLDILILAQEDDHDVCRSQDRLDALRCWQAQVVTSTVDTVLGLVQNHRKGLYAWAGLANAAVVFDEIHAYDDSMFGSLLRFIAGVPGVPLLLMTASLPSARRAALERIVKATHLRPLQVIAGPADLESIARYVQRRSHNPWTDIEACVAQGGKVLYVCNTVDRCRERATEAAMRGLQPKVYHSRFRYEDRVKRHGDVIEAFRRQGGALALTTQVAEMSLDLSADLLVTESAPISALIQRLGRLNRRATPESPGQPKPFIVLEPSSHHPYEQLELDEAARWLERLGDESLSQSQLLAAWDDRDDEVSEVRSAWLDGCFRTKPAELREPSIGIQVLLEEDAVKVKSRTCRAVAVALPMPSPKRDWLRWDRIEGYVVAPKGTVEYDERLGAQWR